MNKIKAIRHRIKSYNEVKKRMFPSIFIAGFQKCGTTSLYDYLSQVTTIVPGEIKEKNDLSFDSFDMYNYIINFPLIKKGKSTLCGSHQLTYAPYGIERLKKIAPNCKIILIMRNPVDRAYSLYQHGCRFSTDSEKSFEEWLDIELNILDNISNIEDVNEVYHATKWRGRPEGSWDLKSKLSSGMCVSRGIYYNYIKEIKGAGFDFYPIFLENLQKDFYKEMTLLLEFLHLDKMEIENINPNVKNIGGYKNKMNDKTRILLEEFYKPHNEKLFNLLKIENPWS